MRVFQRWAVKRDLPQILEVERSVFSPAWSESDFLSVMRQRNGVGFVAEVDNRIVGFVFYELHKDRLRIVNLAVRHDRHRQGIGAAIVRNLVNKLHQSSRCAIELEVSEKSVGTCLFLRSQGFRAVRILAGYCETGEDAYLFQYAKSIQPRNRLAEYTER